jgi:hypothetical protein
VYKIDFDKLNLANGAPIVPPGPNPPGYTGYEPDPVPFVVSYRVLDNFGGNLYSLGLDFHNQIGGLSRVAYYQKTQELPAPDTRVAEVAIVASEGYCLLLNSFQLASSQVPELIGIQVFGDNNPPKDFSQEVGLVPKTVNPALAAKKVGIQWSLPWDIAIDNITFAVDPCSPAVPEPATLVSWMLGVGAFGFVAYRRRRLARG